MIIVKNVCHVVVWVFWAVARMVAVVFCIVARVVDMIWVVTMNAMTMMYSIFAVSINHFLLCQNSDKNIRNYNNYKY